MKNNKQGNFTPSQERYKKVHSLIDLAVKHGYSETELLEVFLDRLNDLRGKRAASIFVDCKKIVCNFAEEYGEMIDPKEGKYIIIENKILSLSQLDKIRTFFENEIFTTVNEQQALNF